MNEMHDYIEQLQKKHSNYTIKEYSGIVENPIRLHHSEFQQGNWYHDPN